MLNLLSANFMRLKKSVLYKICIIFSIALPLFEIRETIFREGQYTLWYDYEIYIGFAAAIFVSMFIGDEFTAGAIRNKISVGCTRLQVYLSMLITVSAAALGIVFVWTLTSIFAMPRFGFLLRTPEEYFLSILFTVMSTLALCALYTLISYVIGHKTYALLLCIILCTLLVICGSDLYNKLCEPEEVSYGIITTYDGEPVMSDPIPNPDYVDGTKREVFNALVNINPCGQMILMANLPEKEGIADPVLITGSSVVLYGLVSALGVLIFRRKNIR